MLADPSDPHAWITLMSEEYQELPTIAVRIVFWVETIISG